MLRGRCPVGWAQARPRGSGEAGGPKTRPAAPSNGAIRSLRGAKACGWEGSLAGVLGPTSGSGHPVAYPELLESGAQRWVRRDWEEELSDRGVVARSQEERGRKVEGLKGGLKHTTFPTSASSRARRVRRPRACIKHLDGIYVSS